MPLRNWGGTYRYRADSVTSPTTVDELIAVIGSAPSVRVVGTRHSFSGISDAAVMISLGALGERFELDHAAMTVTIDGAMTYGRLAELLAPHGLALHNLASLAHLNVAGAVATGTHGSGDANGNLSTAVVGIEVMTATGEVVAKTRADSEFAAMVVGLGAFGAVISLTLELETSFDVEQQVYESVPLGDFIDDIDGVFASAYSVSAFTTWSDTIEQVWVKHRVGEQRQSSSVLARSARATAPRHPIAGGDVTACTEQLGRTGPWSQRLPHFRFDAIPNAGEEVQSEYFVPRSAAEPAVAALRALSPQLQGALLTSELRTVAADGLWLSPCFERDSLALHFTWRPDEDAAGAAAAQIEQVLRPFEPRPHWGKLFTPGFSTTCHYSRRTDAIDLIEEMDPGGVFSNDWLRDEALRSR